MWVLSILPLHFQHAAILIYGTVGMTFSCQKISVTSLIWWLAIAMDGGLSMYRKLMWGNERDMFPGYSFRAKWTDYHRYNSLKIITFKSNLGQRLLTSWYCNQRHQPCLRAMGAHDVKRCLFVSITSWILTGVEWWWCWWTDNVVITKFFFKLVLQAYRFLREEVKTFRGKPIMVQFIFLLWY